MFREKIPGKQLGGWIFAALVPVVIQLGAGGSWVETGVAALACGGAVWLVWRFGAQRIRWLCLPRLVLTVVMVGVLVSNSAFSWPGDNYPAVPLILLALAGWSAWKGPSAAARVGCVLFWFVLLMYLVVFGAGLGSVKVGWLRPWWRGVDLEVVLLLLVPALAMVLLRSEERWSGRVALPGAFLVAASVLVSGVMSPALAEEGFYEMSKGLELLGVVSRFEAVISAGMTLGWFSLLSLLLSVCGRLAEELRKGWGRWGVVAGATGGAVWMLCDLSISMGVMAVLVTIFWVLLPLLEQGVGREKKS
ncbi:MAG: hypothetical protein IJW45_09635 [Oscillospiraceae bacterium]|nr:hypothetical protein [Oscillospiraceae bacterium]